ncbi:MAG: Fic/DOC family N-terminal domain-containing protein [Candidatus Cloacimonadales bacterium]
MKIKFDSNLEFQREMIESIAGIFEGQNICNNLLSVSHPSGWRSYGLKKNSITFNAIKHMPDSVWQVERITMNNKFDPKKPHNDLDLLPPKINFESPKLFKQLIKTHKVLAELKGYSEKLPNKKIILNSIILQEAKDSSEVENIVTTHDKLYKALSVNDINIDAQTKEVLDYRKALFTGFDLIQKNNILTSNMLIKIQESIEENTAGFRKLPGTTLANAQTGEVMYTPPDNYSDIARLMSNLENFINTDDDEIDPLIKLALIHYQFESIHPFYDGNGRTGRIINVLYLVLKDLLKEPFLYLSSYIIKNKSEYYRLLRNVTKEDNWEEWVFFILTAIEETSEKTLITSQRIMTLFENVSAKIYKDFPKIYSKELVKILFTNVYTRISDLVDNGIASRNIASNYLQELSPEILTKEKVGRETIYINKGLYDLFKNMH